MRIKSLVATMALGAIALAACGGGSYSSGSAKPKRATPIATATTGTVAVKSGDTSLGKVLVDANGLTLYGLTKDTNGIPTCVGVCANTWPPLTVDGASLPAGLDAKLFSVVSRPDGSHQLKAGKWPLYTYSGDAKPGDVNGQGTGGFFAVGADGKLVKNAPSSPTTAAASDGSGSGYGQTTAPTTVAKAPAPAIVKSGMSSLGPVLVDAKGLTLYGLTQDSNGMPTCVDACATAWPPLTVDGASLPAGLDAKLFSVVSRPDGSHQLKAGKWPLYRFAGDAAPGDVNGQGTAGVWYVVIPNGSLNKG